MAEWSSSLLLQSLGWATLNSFWQFALIWCFYLIANHYFRLSSNHKYQLSVISILIGLAWFVYTFADFYQGQSIASPLFQVGAIEVSAVLPKVLSAASVAYLILLVFPAYRICRNWGYIQKIKRKGLHKANLHQRLFVRKISGQLGIGKKVMVYVSSIVKSPVTVGYLKPIILLPLASFNNLTVEQTEAILLHELSHIRRSDYLVNLLLTFVHGILYFNPFVKFLIDRAEQERENCCDELVLQYQYDKVSYASALLKLEKTAQDLSVLALGAARKNHLLSRIEKIVGIARKPSFERVRFAGAFIFLIVFLAANTMMLSGTKKFENLSLDPLANHFSFFTNNDEDAVLEPGKTEPVSPNHRTESRMVATVKRSVKTVEIALTQEDQKILDYYNVPSPSGFMHASYIYNPELDRLELTTKEIEQVSSAVANTKKVLETVQWKEMEKAIADGMNAQEKLLAKQEYLTALDKMNWTKMEENLKQSYADVNWEKVNVELKEALTVAAFDSAKKAQQHDIKILCKVQATLNANCVVNVMPDVSVKQATAAKAQITQKVEELKIRRARPIVSL